MIKQGKYFKKGITFMEIMIVVGIIAVLAAAVLVSMSAAKKRNENSAMILLVKDYEKAVNDFMYLSNNGNYPNVYTGPPDTLANILDCLGPDGTCWGGQDLGRSADIDSGGVLADIEDHIQGLPTRTMIGCGSTDYESPVYWQDASGNGIYFTLRGQNTCELGTWAFNLGTECVGCYVLLQK